MKILGESIGPWRQRRFYDPNRGMVYEWTRTGTIDAIRAVEASLTPGTVYEIDETSPPQATITLRTPEVSDGNGDGILSVSFELARNITQQSGYEHPKSLALSAENLRTIRSAIKNNSTTGVSELTGNASSFYNLLLNGKDAYVISNFVFRITQMIQRTAQVGIAFTGTGTIYTSTQLKNEVNAGAVYNTAIDNAYAALVAGQYQGAIPSGYTPGWLKQAPTISSVSGNRSAVSVEYWLEAWSTYYYA
jgi:hypothetical protein